jgi:hyperosmotically inducible protein
MCFIKGDIIMNLLKLSFLTGLLLFATQAFSQTDQNNGTSSNAAVITPDKTIFPANNVKNVKAQTPEDDAAITKTLKKLISQSKMLSKLQVNISTNKGVVTIEGNIDSDTQASSLVEHAESIIGVSDVDTSKLTVKDSQHPLTDTLITAKIKGLFIREKLFGEKDIAAINTSVETKDGVVYLSGIVDNQQQINNAIAIIKKYVPEVKEVEYSVKKVIPVNQGNKG